MRGSVRVGALALAAIGAMIGAGGAGGAERERLSPLHAKRGDAPAVVDARGREVLLRGVNVNGLGDYYQANPAHRTVFPVRRSDFRRIARIGFNSVRLIVNWSRLEPTPGAFDRGYVKRIRRAVRQARRFGMYTIIDMHQDAWGKHVFTPPEEECAPGFNRAVGWDGAPEWATLTDGLPTCHAGLRELSPAVGQAWQSFYLDREGIQTALVETWARLARAFAGSRAVAGWDLINEPNPGLAPGPNDTVGIGSYYDRAIAAIREAEALKRRGFHHIAFFEPGIAWSAAQTNAIPPPTFTADENIVFAPHIYAESISPVSIGQAFENAEAAAETYGVTVWSGEWGYFGDPAAEEEKAIRYGQAEDAYLYGGAWWDWKQACGDPHVIHEPGGEPDALSPSLVRVECPGDRTIGIPKEFRRVLARPLPRAVPGRLDSVRSDGTALTLEVSGRAGPERRCGLRLYYPRRVGRPQVSGDVDRVRFRRANDDWIVTGCVSGRWGVALRPRGT